MRSVPGLRPTLGKGLTNQCVTRKRTVGQGQAKLRGTRDQRIASGAVTTAMVQSKHGTLQRTFAGTLGLAKTIAGDEKKVSVAFLEKTAETVSARA